MEYINSYLKLANAADEILSRQGTSSRRVDSSSLVPRRDPSSGRKKLEELDAETVATGYMASIKDTFSEEEEMARIKSYLQEQGLAVVEQADEDTPRPRAREDFYEDTGLTEDPEFMLQLKRMQEKFPSLTESELFRVIKGESAFNPKAMNKDTNAAGLFQFMPKVAAELGFTTQDILSMAPAEQLKVYEKYLDRWNYSGKNSLAIMQAAPAYANASDDTVIYKKGSKAWKLNPGWRPANGGDITVKSINDYYGRTS